MVSHCPALTLSPALRCLHLTSPQVVIARGPAPLKTLVITLLSTEILWTSSARLVCVKSLKDRIDCSDRHIQLEPKLVSINIPGRPHDQLDRMWPDSNMHISNSRRGMSPLKQLPLDTTRTMLLVSSANTVHNHHIYIFSSIYWSTRFAPFTTVWILGPSMTRTSASKFDRGQKQTQRHGGRR